MAASVQEVITTCPRDCPDTCGIIAEVREGRVVRLRGARDHPITRGFLCPKMYQYPRMLESSHRLKTPLLRRGRDLVPVSFAEAYEAAARAVEKAAAKHGSRSLLLYHLSGNQAVLNTLDRRFFNLLGGATRNAGGLCLANAVKGQELDFGRGRLGHSPLDLARSRAILFWGRNAADTQPHLFYQAAQARKKGAYLAAVDPRASRTARQADLHVAVKPGGDWALALLLAREVLERGEADPDFLKNNPRGREGFLALVKSQSRQELLARAGVPPVVLEELASSLVARRPAAIYLGVGMTYWPWGVETVRLINALGALLGTLGQPGGGVNLSFPGWQHLDQTLTGDPRGERYLYEPNLAREMPALTDPPLKLAWVVGGNPLAQVPNSSLLRQAFAALDFVIVNELFLTDTARQADLVFPVSSFLEREDLLGSWGHNYLSPVNPALDTELPSDLEVFQKTARLLGLEREMAGTPAEWLDRFLGPLHSRGITWEMLKKGWVKNPLLPDIPSLDPYGFNVITTLPSPGREPAAGEYNLLTPKPRHQTHSQKLPRPQAGLPLLFLSASDAAGLGVREGDELRVSSPRGSLSAAARLDPTLLPGSVYASSGGWVCEGQGVNLLTLDSVTGAGGMTVNDTRVRLEKVEGRQGKEGNTNRTEVKLS